MKFKLLALAAAAVLSCNAQAALFGGVFNPANFTLVEAADGTTTGTYSGAAVGKVLVISGASASAKTLGTFVIEDNCDKTTLAVMWDSASGSNYRAYACDMKAGNIINGGTVDSLVVLKRDAGGSLQGVAPIYVPTKINAMRVGAFSTAAVGGVAATNNCTATGNAASLNVPSYLCASTVNVFPDAGTSDVEPAIINNPVNGGTNVIAVGTVTTKSIFQQIIGVATNLKLYRALQATQGLTQDDAEANRPSLPTSFISSAVLGKLSPGAKKGWELVVNGAVVPGETAATVAARQINVCRRVNGSGTQAAANIMFAENPCSSGGQSSKVSTGTSPSIASVGTGTAVFEGSSTGLVETCLGTTAESLGAYAIGHIGRDNDPLIGTVNDKKYRFVKLDGAQPEAHTDTTTGACTAGRNFAGCNDAQSGKYRYVFESTMQYNSGTPGNAAKKVALDNIANNGFKAAQLQGNSAAVIAGVMSLPTYSGFFENLAVTSNDAIYGSRVTRGANSCSPLYLTK